MAPKPTLKILTVSDFKDQDLIRQIESKTFEPVDLVISCGDLDPEYLSFLRDRVDRPLFYVKGNHDIRYTPGNPMGCENIHKRIVTFEGINILGLEGSMWYNGGQNQYTEAMMKKMIFSLWFPLWRKGRIHIIATHAAPRKIHDREDLCHMGFESFNGLIKKRQPQVFVHGHIHEEFKHPDDRVTQVGDTSVVNTCGYHILEVTP